MPGKSAPLPSDKLDRIVELLEQMNRRDRLRMVGGLVRTLILLLPIVLMLAVSWYFYTNFDVMIEKIIQQVTGTTQQQSVDFMKQLEMLLKLR